MLRWFIWVSYEAAIVRGAILCARGRSWHYEAAKPILSSSGQHRERPVPDSSPPSGRKPQHSQVSGGLPQRLWAEVSGIDHGLAVAGRRPWAARSSRATPEGCGEKKSPDLSIVFAGRSRARRAAQVRSAHRRDGRVLHHRGAGDDNSGLFRAAERRLVPRRSSPSLESRAVAGRGGSSPAGVGDPQRRSRQIRENFFDVGALFRPIPCLPRLPGVPTPIHAPCKIQCAFTILGLGSILDQTILPCSLLPIRAI
jgi:hypothetical protein